MSQEASIKKMQKDVLVVDDSRLVLNVHAMLLEDAGYNPTLIENASEALEQAMQKQFAAVLVDLNMPRMNGYEFTRRLRKVENYQKVPVIMITTESEGHDRQQALDSGVDVYLTKPLDSASLFLQLGMLLGTKSSHHRD